MKKYEDLWRIANKYYADTNCCSVVALAITTDSKFGKCRKRLEEVGRQHRAGVNMLMLGSALYAMGYTFERVEVDRCTMTTVARRLNRNEKYMVFVRGHVAAVADGMVQDWTDGRRHKVQMVWRIIKK